MLDVTPRAVTVTSTVPAAPENRGTVALMIESETTLNAAGTPPKVTSVVPVKPLPLIVTVAPPVRGAVLGVIEVIIGTMVDGRLADWTAAPLPLDTTLTPPPPLTV